MKFKLHNDQVYDMVAHPELKRYLEKSLPFIMARRKENGGFGATPRLPATAEDTYHALNVLRLAQRYYLEIESVPEAGVTGHIHFFLASRGQLFPAGLRTTFQHLWCCRTSGLNLDQNNIRETVTARMKASISLEDWYYGVRIIKELLNDKSGEITEAPNLITVMNKKWRTVKEAWMNIYLWQKIRQTLPCPRPELITWLQACQNSDGGFGFFPGTTSFVENSYACLRTLKFLDQSPLNRDRAYRFLTGCQTISGGFSRSSRAAPFLDTTWYGLAALTMIY